MVDTFSFGFNQTFHQAVKAAQQRNVTLPEIYYSAAFRGIARQQAFSIAGIASLDTLTIVRNSLAAKLQSGQTFAEWKKDILESGTLDLPPHRLENIFRTNIQSNYARGSWEQFVQSSDALPYLLYDAINDSRVDDECLALDGMIKPVNDPFWNVHAPLQHYMCRCTLIQITANEAINRSRGTDHGLNKPVDLEAMQPQPGWDYNPGQDVMKGINNALAGREISAPAPLLNAMKEVLTQHNAANAGMIAAQQVITHNVTPTTPDIIAVATPQELQSYLEKLKLLPETYFILDEIKRVETKLNEFNPG
jgi:SPP1 gp7 family putative phage head morphogenesis protein